MSLYIEMTSNVPSNSTRTLLSANASYFGLWASTASYNGVYVLARSDVEGELYLQFSTNRTTIDFEVFIPVGAGETQTLQQTINAPNFRVKYVNGTTQQTSFLVWSSLTTSYPTDVSVAVDLDYETSSITVWAMKPDETQSPLQMDASGNLKTTATLSVGGTLNVSDASSHELLADLSSAIYEQTNSLLYDLDIIANHGNDASANALALITAVETQTTDLSNALTAVVDGLKDISGSVSVSNFPALQETHDASSVAILETLNEAVGNIELNTTILGVQPVHLSLTENGADVWADGYPWIVPATGEDGWAYINEYGVTGTQLYYYANAPALRPLSIEPNITLGSVECGWFIGNQKLLTDPDNRFIMNIYTQPTGVDDFAFWYHSRRAYQVSSSVVLSKAVDYFFYWGTDPTLLHPEYKHIELSLVVSEGDLLPNEVVEFMSVNVPTIPPINEFYGVVKQAGFVGTDTIRNVYFDNDVSFKAETQLGLLDFSGTELLVRDASAIALLAEIANGITVEVGEVDISGVGVVDGKLSVYDVSANGELITIREILADIVPVANYGLLNDTPTYLPIRVDASGAMLVSVNNSQTVVEISGGVVADLSGSSFTDSRLNVFDASSNEHLFAIEDILETGFVNVYDASCELVLDAINTQTEKLTFVDNDISNNLLVLDLTNNAILSQLSFFTDDDTTTLLRVKQVGSVNVINPEGQTLAVSGNVGLIAEQTVGIEGSVQTHNFASSNGTDWHHLHSDANGNIITLSRTHDGAGNDIASTDFGTYRALNVAISGNPVVEISGNPIVEISGNVVVSASASQYGSYGNLANNVATILPAGVSTGIDVSAWSYFVGAYEDYYSGTPATGFLRLQYSFDNTTYYDLFNTTVSPSGTGTPRRGNFQKQDIPAINWIRFKNDTNQTMASVTITLLGASLS